MSTLARCSAVRTCGWGVWQILSRRLNETFGRELSVVHAFSCEMVPFKQDFIRAHFQPDAIFENVSDMGSAAARTVDGPLKVVPYVDNFSGGMECDSISSRNADASDYKNCIELA